MEQVLLICVITMELFLNFYVLVFITYQSGMSKCLRSGDKKLDRNFNVDFNERKH